MSANPSRAVASGVGKPRLIKDMPAALWTSAAGTTTFGADYVQDTGGISTNVLLGMRITATLRVNTGGQDFDYVMYAKVTEVDVPGNRYYVDGWIGGTPTNGIAAVADGWIADLPRTLRGGLRETFTPIVNVLKVYRNRKYVKAYGYDYIAIFDYGQKADPDMLFDLRWILQQTLEGSDEAITLIPRSDVPGINYEVYLEDDLTFILHESQDFHKGLTLGFRGKAAVAVLPQLLYGGYGTGHGQKYGIQL